MDHNVLAWTGGNDSAGSWLAIFSKDLTPSFLEGSRPGEATSLHCCALTDGKQPRTKSSVCSAAALRTGASIVQCKSWLMRFHALNRAISESA